MFPAGLLAAIVGSSAVRLLLGAIVAVATTYLTFQGWLYFHDRGVARVAKEELRVESKEAGKVAGGKSEVAHAEAEKSEAFKALLKNSCRDCK